MIRVHLATFNHLDAPLPIIDQIKFLKWLFRHLGIAFSWGGGFCSDALNLLIENLTAPEIAILERFNRDTGKRLGIILTEHFRYQNGALYFNTTPLSHAGGFTDYHRADDVVPRFVHLFAALAFTRKLYTLGDYPDLGFLRALQVPTEALSIPFPPVPAAGDPPARPRLFDFVFTGTGTRFRNDILEELGRHYRVQALPASTPPRARARLYRDAAFILNLPQNTDWQWTSPLRMLAALGYGRVVVSLFTAPQSEIDDFAFHVRGPAVAETLRRLLTDSPERIERHVIQRYNATAQAPERWLKLRRDLFEWAVAEGVA